MSSNTNHRDVGVRWYVGVPFVNPPGADGKAQIEQNILEAALEKIGGRTLSTSGVNKKVAVPVNHVEVTDTHVLAVFENSAIGAQLGASAFKKVVVRAVREWHNRHGPIGEPTRAEYLETGTLPATTLTDGSDDAGLQSVRDRLEAAAVYDDVDEPETPLYLTLVPERPLTERETAALESKVNAIVGYRNPRFRIVNADVTNHGVVIYVGSALTGEQHFYQQQAIDGVLERFSVGRRTANGDQLKDPEFWTGRELGSAGDLDLSRERVLARLEDLAGQQGLEVPRTDTGQSGGETEAKA